MLMLSGIQHFAFCPRQWALVHIEQQWEENHLTIEGRWLHRNVDNPLATERNKNVVYLRSVALISHNLGLYGIADVLELSSSDSALNTITIPKYPGRWTVVPVEYKHGKPKRDEIDEVQLCAQAMCIEEMFNIQITQGFFYYGATRQRTEVHFTDKLRSLVTMYAHDMHNVFIAGVTPQAEYKPCCKSCSLNEKCFVTPMKKATNVNYYLRQLNEE